MTAPALLPSLSASDVTPARGHWLESLQDWPVAALRSLRNQDAVVRVVIASTRGSSPREVGTCMLVERERIVGTIGGGQLEWAAIDAARAMLTQTAIEAARVMPSQAATDVARVMLPQAATDATSVVLPHAAPAVELRKFVLGPQLAQCCGGVVELWLERFTRADVALLDAAAQAASRGPAMLIATTAGERRILRHPTLDRHARDMMHRGLRAQLVRDESGATTFHERLDDEQPAVWLYGAGHVGQALVRVLASLPIRITWIDSRAELLPGDVPAPVRVMHSADPVATVATAPRGTRFLVMTHSHPLDYELCKAALQRDDHPWVGVIGSKSKGARFRSRLTDEGVSSERVSSLVCPIGVGGIDSKQPAAIAVSVAAQLLQTSAGIDAEQPVTACPSSHDGGACATCSASSPLPPGRGRAPARG